MKIISYFSLAAFFAMAITMTGYSHRHEHQDVLFQTSTINALLEGIYNGQMTCEDLKQYGDLGIGTFNDLDGEMVGLEGKFYQIKADGKAYLADGSMRTPFAVMTFFEPDMAVLLDKSLDYEQLKPYVDSVLPTRNIFYALRIEASFDHVKTRSVPKQNRPYPPLVEVVKNQPTFEFHNVKGTIAGFRCPGYVKGINVPGYHLHFISEDRKTGGHLLECGVRDVRIEIDYTSEFHLTLPGSTEFYQQDLEKEKGQELEKVER